MKEEPLVSVILPVYNAGKYIADSIQSILNQTYRNFELIILNDGSTDDTAAVVASFTDKRINYHEHPNMGMAATLNKGIQLAEGSIIARQDADDISYPERFAKQMTFLINEPEIAMVGSWARVIKEGPAGADQYLIHPSSNSSLQLFLLFDNPFVHSSMMIRKSALIESGGYQINKASLIQDYDLWSRIANKFPIANLPEILLDYREVSSGISQGDIKKNTYKDKVVDQSLENLAKYIEFDKMNTSLLSQLFHRAAYIKPSLWKIFTSLTILKNIVSQIEPNWKNDKELNLTYIAIRNRILGNLRSMFYPRIDFLYYLTRDIKNKFYKV